MKLIHEKKNADYASNDNPFENFERSGNLAEWFNDPIDKSFVILIGTKLARLATLLNKDEVPNNESIDDSFLDLATYVVLWKSYRQRNKTNPIITPSNIFSNSDRNQSICNHLFVKSYTWSITNKQYICDRCGITII